MFILKCLVVVSVVSCVFGDKPDARVIGGEEAPMGKFPHQASLQQWDNHMCSGSILSNRWLLSAAHCLGVDHATVAVVGTHNLEEGGTKYEISEIFVHALFNPIIAWSDIALLKTTKEIKFGQNVSPIALGVFPVRADVEVLFSGWGMTRSPNGPWDEETVSQLRYVKLKTISNSECYKESFLPISPKQICAVAKKGEGACPGDSGGALVNLNNDKLIGILSRATAPDRCGAGTPDVYMRVSSYIMWIKRHMILK